MNSAFTRISCADCYVVFPYSLVCQMTCANAWSPGARRISRTKVPKTDVCGRNFTVMHALAHYMLVMMMMMMMMMMMVNVCCLQMLAKEWLLISK